MFFENKYLRLIKRALAPLLACSFVASFPAEAANGKYSVVNGKITDPSGAVFVARGINISFDQLNCCYDIAARLFPRTNFVRLNFRNYPPVSEILPYVTRATDAGVVVVLDDHTSTAQIYTGAKLTTELNWFRALAYAFRANPRVWFGTLNEPDIDYYNNPPLRTFAEMIAQQKATYDAIRGAGNNNPILMELRGGWYAYPTTAFASNFAKMTNIIWDLHFYGWISKFSTDQNVVNAALAAIPGGENYGGINIMQSLVRSADGVVPVILGEYGPSTFGSECDRNYNQVLFTAQQAGFRGFGAAAWHFNAGADRLTSGSSRSNYGAEVEYWQRTAASYAFAPCP